MKTKCVNMYTACQKEPGTGQAPAKCYILSPSWCTSRLSHSSSGFPWTRRVVCCLCGLTNTSWKAEGESLASQSLPLTSSTFPAMWQMLSEYLWTKGADSKVGCESQRSGLPVLCQADTTPDSSALPGPPAVAENRLQTPARVRQMRCGLFSPAAARLPRSSNDRTCQDLLRERLYNDTKLHCLTRRTWLLLILTSRRALTGNKQLT